MKQENGHGTMGMEFIGCAGWALRREQQPWFAGEGTHLERYASRFPAVEVNSSFYRSHRPATWTKWAASVPDEFRFSVKMPREISHELRLRDVAAPLKKFLGEVSQLEDRLGPLLVQLPPSLPFEAEHVEPFFDLVRASHDGLVACEPRHQSWFRDDVDQLLKAYRVEGVAADPPRRGQTFGPFGDRSFVYYRLHGSPKIYYSSYPDDFLDKIAGTLRAHAEDGEEPWCIFDNTADGHAVENALELNRQIQRAG